MSFYDIKSMTLPELKAELSNNSLPAYRAKQLYEWLHKNTADSYEEMSNLPQELRAYLKANYPLLVCKIIQKKISQCDETVKYLFELDDGETIESVLMKYKHGYTLCISTQVGCKSGCVFCATGTSGLVRNLAPSEMLSQIYSAQRDMDIRISNVVLMGMGEPLQNYKNVIRFVELVTDPYGLHISMRNITLSTCGIVPALYMLLENRFQLTLSISLHAPNDKIRTKLMPINRKYPLEELLTACKEYSLKTSRRISFEYALFKDINDTESCAKQLAKRLKDIPCHINLIPANSVKGSPCTGSDAKVINAFKDILLENYMNVTVRRTLGSDIDASCGQLRARVQEHKA